MIRTVAETGSTNDDVAALARDGAEEGLWLRAERQTGGRGRQGRAWVSSPGNLHASTLVRLALGDPPAPTLALLCGVALAEALSHWRDGLMLKWPNDLLLDGAKVAGILLEREGDAVIAGFGVNLLHAPDLADRQTATVTLPQGEAPDPAAVLRRLADVFARWLARWRSEGLVPLRDHWLAQAHGIGTMIAVHSPDGAAIEGSFAGLGQDGALRLRLADGAIHVIHAGDVWLL